MFVGCFFIDAISAETRLLCYSYCCIWMTIVVDSPRGGWCLTCQIEAPVPDLMFRPRQPHPDQGSQSHILYYSTRECEGGRYSLIVSNILRCVCLAFLALFGVISNSTHSYSWFASHDMTRPFPLSDFLILVCNAELADGQMSGHRDVAWPLSSSRLSLSRTLCCDVLLLS